MVLALSLSLLTVFLVSEYYLVPWTSRAHFIEAYRLQLGALGLLCILAILRVAIFGVPTTESSSTLSFVLFFVALVSDCGRRALFDLRDVGRAVALSVCSILIIPFAIVIVVTLATVIYVFDAMQYSRDLESAIVNYLVLYGPLMWSFWFAKRRLLREGASLDQPGSVALSDDSTSDL